MNAPALAAIDSFFRHLSLERRLSPHTSSSYSTDLECLVAFCDRQKLNSWDALEGRHVRSFAAAEHRRGISPKSIQRRLSATRSFFKYLLREGKIATNPATDIQAPKAKKCLPSTL